MKNLPSKIDLFGSPNLLSKHSFYRIIDDKEILDQTIN